MTSLPIGEAKATAAAAATHAAATIYSFAQRQDGWTHARHPLHADKPEKAGVGPGLAFAERLRSRSGAACIGGIALVPCAFGGSELARWEAAPHRGDLFDECVRRVQLSLETPPPDGRPVKLAGILWHQGENDCGDAASAATYAKRLPAALDALRCAIGGGGAPVPILLGELGYWLDQSDADYVHATTINAAIVDAPGRLPCSACVSAHGLAHKGDRLHFDAQASEELGRRYADEWLRLVEIADEHDADALAGAGALAKKRGSGPPTKPLSASGDGHAGDAPQVRAWKRPRDESIDDDMRAAAAAVPPFGYPQDPHAADANDAWATTEAAVRD